MFELFVKEYVKGEHAVRVTEFSFFHLITLFRIVKDTTNNKAVDLLTPKKVKNIKGFKNED